MPFHPGAISDRFGSIKEACNRAGVRCDALYGKEHMQHIANCNTKYTKENLKRILINSYKKYGIMRPTDFILKINKDNKIDIRGAICKFFGTVSNALKESNIPYKNYYWSKKRIINALQQLDKKFGPLCKFEINKIYSKQGLICKYKCIKDTFGSIEEAAKEANIIFVEPQDKGHPFNGKKGKTEKYFLKSLPNNKNIISQYRIEIDNQIYFLDAYDPINNIVYELDGEYHKYEQQRVLDEQRDVIIKEELNCEIIRIKEY